MDAPLPARLRRVGLFSLVMILCASGFNAAMDTLSFRYRESVFAALPARYRSWFDPGTSYQNKWRDGDRTKGERFPLSSTSLVAVTDAWHFFKFLAILCLFAAVIAPFTLVIRLRWHSWLLIYLAADLLRGIVFEVFFTKILIK